MTTHTVNAHGVDPATVTQAHADRVAAVLGLAEAHRRTPFAHALGGLPLNALTLTDRPYRHPDHPDIVTVPWSLIAGLGELHQPTEAMIEAGGFAVEAARALPGWTPGHHYKSCGRDMTGIPGSLLDFPGPLPKHVIAMLVWRAMNAAAARDSRTPNDPATDGCSCHGCGRTYRSDLLVPDTVWERIRPPDHKQGGLLCPTCIMDRITDAGIWHAGFSVSAHDDQGNPTATLSTTLGVHLGARPAGGEFPLSETSEVGRRLLAADQVLDDICKRMAGEFQADGTRWPREWMEKHSGDRATLILARTALLSLFQAPGRPAEGRDDG